MILLHHPADRRGGAMGMGTVVIQRDVMDLFKIKETVESINQDIASNTSFLSDPFHAIKRIVHLVKQKEHVLVVCGEFILSADGIISAADIADIVRTLFRGSEILFFTYSIAPRLSEDIDGSIPKDEDANSPTKIDPHGLLARILTSDLREATPESLKNSFPEIELNPERAPDRRY